MRALLPCLIACFSFSGGFGRAAEPLRLASHERSPEGRVEATRDSFVSREPLRLPPGFTANVWAAEPMLANPWAISFDDLGRLFVTETHRYRTSALDVRDYPGLLDRDLALRTVGERAALLEEVFGGQAAQLRIESNRIRLIEDTTGSGRADRSSLVDGLSAVTPADGVAAGVLAQGRQVWVAQSPGLARLNLDATAPELAKREELLRGFGVHVGRAGHDLQGLIIGPDGKLYFTMGDRGARVETKEGRTLDVSDQGAIFRCDPNGGGLEVVATGLRNPRDLAFDDFGNLFTADGDAGRGDRARLIQVIEGGDSGWRLAYQDPAPGPGDPWLSEGLWRPRFEAQPAYLLPPISNIESGPTGFAHDPGTTLTSAYRGRFFLAHSDEGSAGGVRTFALQPVGAGFAMREDKAFVVGAIPTDLAFAPDGRLFLSDWVSAWPWPKSGRGRIHAVAVANPSPSEMAVAAETRRLLAEGASNRSSEQLATALAHPDQRVRLAAQFALAERGGGSLPIFEAVAGDTTAPRLARVHAIWGLGQLALTVPAALNRFAALMADKDGEVRAQTAKVVGDTLRIEAFAVLRLALQDPEPRVAFYAAQSLGKLRRPDAIPALLGLLRKNDDEDPVLRHAVVVALSRLGADPLLASTAQDASRAVRLGGLLAYRRLADPAVGSFLSDFDPAIVREAARAINDLPISAALPALAALLDTAPLDDTALVLRALNAHFVVGQPENAEALAAFASRSYVPASLRAEALRYLACWAKPPARDRSTGLRRELPARDAGPATKAMLDFLSRLNGSTPEEVQVATIQAVAELAVPGTGHALWDVVYQASRPTGARIAALQALEKLNDLRLEVAAQHAARSERLALRRAAIPVLQRRHPAVALPLFGILASKGTPVEQREVFAALAGIDDPRADEMLLQGLRRLEAGGVPVAAQAELLDAAAARSHAGVASAMAKLQQTWQTGADRIAPYRSSLEGGDRAEGRKLFLRHPLLACLKCHEAGRGGSEAGPVLTDVGQRRSKESVLETLITSGAHQRLSVGTSLSRTELRDLMAFLTEAESTLRP